MAGRSVTIALKAKVGDFTAGIGGAKKSVQDLSRNMTETGASADRMRRRLEAATKALPKIEIDADSTPAEIRFAQIRTDLEKLGSKKIGIDIDAATALAQIATLERELEQLSRDEVSVDVRADITAAVAELRTVQGEVNRLDGETARVKVNADVAGALTSIGLVTAALASLPAATTVGVGVAGLGAAFGAAGAGAVAFGAVAVPAMGRVTDAVTEMEKKAESAGTKFDQLSKREQQMAKDLKAFKDAYVDWQRSLEGDVFPAIKGGLDLVESQLPRISPLVKSAGRAFVDLEKDASAALNKPIFNKLLFDLNTQVPGAIDGLGNSLLNVGTGFAGILDAFLPFTPTIVGGIEEITRKFADWGTQLGDSNEFKQFVAWAQLNAPKVAEIISNIGGAIGNIAEASMGIGTTALDLVVMLSERLASMSPDQIQAIAGGVAAIFAAAKAGTALKLGAFVILADVLGRMSPGQIEAVALAIGATVLAVKGFQAVSAVSDIVGNLKNKLTDVGGAAGTASSRLESIGKAAGIAGAVVAVAGVLHEVAREASGANISVDGLSTAFDRLDKTGRITGDLATAYGKDLKGSGLLIEGFGDSLRRSFDPTFLDNARTGITGLFGDFSQGLIDLDPAVDKLNGVDQALANMVDSGNVAGAQEGFRRLAKEAKDAGVPIEVLKARLPEYADALQAATGRTDTAAEAMTGMAGQSDTARKAVDDFTSSLGVFSQKTDAAAALAGLKKAYDDVKTAIDEANGKLDLAKAKTDAERDAIIKARDQFGGYISKVDDAAKKQADLAKQTGDAAGATDRAKEAILRQLPKLFELAGKSAEAREQIYKLAESYGISREDAEKATKSAKALRDMLAQLKSKTIKITIEEYYKQAKKTEQQRNSADGNIFRYYAAGGVQRYANGSENHVAQIAPANTIRVWAEPETGGESYIPLAPSKRARSTEILAATAGIMGYQLMPAGKLGLIAMANGGMVAGASTPVMSTGSASGGLTVSISNLGSLTASLDATSQGLNERLAGAGGLLSKTLGEAGTLTKQVEAVGKTADKVASTTSSATSSLTKAIASLTTAITKLTAALGKAGSAAKPPSGSTGSPKTTTKDTTKKNSKPKPKKGGKAETDPNDVTFDRNPPKKPSNQVDGSSGSGGSDFFVGEAAYAGSVAGVKQAARLIGQTAGAVMAGSAASTARSLPINGPNGTETRRPVRRSAPQMGNPNYYSGVFAAGAAQQGSPAGRLAREAAGVGARGESKSSPTLHIENYHEAPNGSARQTAEELNFIGRRS